MICYYWGEIKRMLKHSNFDYRVKGSRAENCVLINTEQWYVNDSNVIVGFNSRGGVANTFITEVLAENLTDHEGELKAGDVILITEVATRLYGARSFSIPIDLDSTKYTDIPYAHIIGKFRKKISFSSLHLLGDYILLKRLDNVDSKEDGFCVTTKHTNSVYEVVKKSDKSDIESKYILLGDNVTTPIMLEGIQYYAASSKDVVAGFNVNAGGYTLSDIGKVYNHYMILTDTQTRFANEGDTIFKPFYDPEQDTEYYSSAYDEYRYEVLVSGQDKFKVGDILLIVPEALEYCTLNGVKYRITHNDNFIMAKVGED